MAYRPRDLDANVYLKPIVRTPETIAKLIEVIVERLTTVDPLLAKWWLAEFRDRASEAVRRRFGAIRREFADVVARNKLIVDGTGGVWLPGVDGFSLILSNSGLPEHTPQDVSLSVSAGGWDTDHQISFGTSWVLPADPALLRFDVRCASILAICEASEAMYCNVFEGAPSRYPDLAGRCMPGSMTYIGPSGAALVAPPHRIFAERRPDGGLLMAATRERFDPDNPDHIAGVRAIHEACAPYNALPEAI